MRSGKGKKEFMQALRKLFPRKMMAVVSILLVSQSLTAAGMEKINPAASTEEIRFVDQVQRYPLLSECSEENQENYIALSVPEKTSYEVKKGDTLWGIARKFYGRGSAFSRIEAANSDAVGKNALIFPGAELLIPRIYYLEKQAGSRGGFSAPACSYDTPAEWVFAYPQWEPCLESVYCPNESDDQVFVHITENRMFPEGVGENFEEMQEKIMESARKTEGVSFSVPEFERYIREDGRELIFYSFICDTGIQKIQYAVAYVTGKKYLAEFIGCCPLNTGRDGNSCYYAIEEITRYMAASFAETEEEKSWASLKYRPYMGYENWAYEDLHNPFAMAAHMYASEDDVAYDGEDKEITFTSKEWEELLRAVIAYHFDMTQEEWEDYSEKPIHASELAWIKEIEIRESPIPGRDTISINGLSPQNATCAQYNLTTLKDIVQLPNLEKLTLEIGSAEDYEALGESQSLKEISIASSKQLEDAGWLKELPQLESLSLRISMFPHLNALGYQKEGESTFAGKIEQKQEQDAVKSASGGTLEEVLEGCKNLKYLELENPDMTDFGFIDKLPNLYAFCLYGNDGDSSQAEARQSLFGEEDHSQVKCLVVDGKWIRNPE